MNGVFGEHLACRARYTCHTLRHASSIARTGFLSSHCLTCGCSLPSPDRQRASPHAREFVIRHKRGSLGLPNRNFSRGIDPIHSTSVAMDRNRAVVHLNPIYNPRRESVPKSDRCLAILTGDDEIPVSRLDFWHGDHPSQNSRSELLCQFGALRYRQALRVLASIVLAGTPMWSSSLELYLLLAVCPFPVLK
jgi:hypothetical protein